MNPRLCLSAWALAQCVFIASADAQGKFVNFETPVVKGVTIAQPTSGGVFAIVCNPDDNSISVIDASTSQFVVPRQPVGLGPTRAVYDAAHSRILTVNNIGDSVSIVDFPLAGGVLQTRLQRTFQVGDAPTDIVIDPASGFLCVLLSGSSEFKAFDDQGQFAVGALLTPRYFGDQTQPATVMKLAWRMDLRSNGKFLVLNQLGGSRLPNTAPNIFEAGLDLIEYTPPSTMKSVAGNAATPTLGTSNMGMALAPNDTLFVVGNDAQNFQDGDANLKVMSTGFVQSRLWLVDTSPKVVDERDLNTDINGQAVSPGDSVSMPTDVVLRSQGGVVQTVYVASFSTDRLVQLDVSGPAKTWQRTIYDLQTLYGPRSGYSMLGPRSLALATVGGQQRLFVYCRLDATLRSFTINANGTLVTTGAPAPINLPDPFPLQHRFGQSLLYNATLSQTGKVSCASCHIDGRTDALAWLLDRSGNTNTPLNLRPHMRDSVTANDPNLNVFPSDRQAMVTQSLQGLLTHPVDNLPADFVNPNPSNPVTLDVKALFSTEPFYWRGRRPNFQNFVEGFTNLLGAQAPSDTDMGKYRDFVFTIMYPPNPEQPLNRRFSGALSPTPSGAMLGMIRFHEQSLNAAIGSTSGMTSGRSCVHCHRLPSGTNTRITETQPRPAFGPFLQSDNPIKSAQLRGIRQREAFLVPMGDGGNPFGSSPPLLLPANTAGLFHDGFTGSVNHLVHSQFTPPGQTGDEVTLFVRQLDTGVASMVSRVATAKAQAQAITSTVTDMETMARAGHCDIVVRRRVSGQQLDLFFNVKRDLYTDPLQPASTTLMFTLPGTSPASPLIPTLVNDDTVVVEAVPVGSGRQIASGQASTLVNAAPTITAFRLVASDPWRELDSLHLTGNVDLNNGANWTGAPVGQPPTVLAMKAFHTALAASSLNLNLSVPQRHEPPRRLRVTGTSIELGAVAELWIPTQWGTAGGQPVVQAWWPLIFDLNPVWEGGNLFWETSATFDPLMTYALMCGWTGAPGVQSAIDTGTPTAPLDPNRNVFVVRVRNEGDPNGSVLVGRLTL
jgi:hypothetical protein